MRSRSCRRCSEVKTCLVTSAVGRHPSRRHRELLPRRSAAGGARRTGDWRAAACRGRRLARPNRAPAGAMADRDDHKFKILLVGNSLAGKSSLLTRFTNDSFEPLQSTIGVDFVSKAIQVDGRRVKMTIWDTYAFRARTRLISPAPPADSASLGNAH
jgi:Ras family